MISRRTVLSAAWATPVIATAVAAPAAAASTTGCLIRFTNATATQGSDPATAYVNVKVLNETGTDTGPVVLTVGAIGGETITKQFANIGPWGDTGQVYLKFHGLSEGTYTIAYSAVADGCTISTKQDVQIAGEW